ncbi:MAG TPA: hypothetical protein VM580_11895 [Labilithrix sp.]|nr:hypothetical protein [Labilithrix sp.]
MTRRSLASFLLCGTASICMACFVPPAERPRPASALDAVAAGAVAAGELARGAKKETAFGWHLEIVGDRAKYFACTSEDGCTFRRVEIPAASLLATELVNRTRPVRDDGTVEAEVDVLRLTITHDVTTKRGGVTTDSRGLVVQ